MKAPVEENGTFTRARKIESPEVLLRLILMWAVAGRSLMDTAAIAAEVGLADVSDVALVKRFAKAGDWLGALASELLVDAQAPLPEGVRIRVLDATRRLYTLGTIIVPTDAVIESCELGGRQDVRRITTRPCT